MSSKNFRHHQYVAYRSKELNCINICEYNVNGHFTIGVQQLVDIFQMLGLKAHCVILRGFSRITFFLKPMASPLDPVATCPLNTPQTILISRDNKGVISVKKGQVGHQNITSPVPANP